MPRDRYDDDRDDDDRDDDDRDDDDRPRRSRRRNDDDDFDRRPKKSSTGKTLLIVFGVLGVVGLVCGGVMFAILWPAVSRVREAASRQQSGNNMKQIALGMHNYESMKNALHKPSLEPPPGSPIILNNDRLSWRVSMLPYIGEESHFKQFQLNEPWNSAANSGPSSQPAKVYYDAIDGPISAKTRYRCFYDNGALFDSTVQITFRSVTDGLANTIAYLDTSDEVPWAQFNEFKFDPNGPVPAIGNPKRDVAIVAMADGSVRFVKKSINPQVLKAAITRNGGEAPPDLGN
jgi:hypothetical protein